MASKNLSLEDKQKFEKHEEKGQAGSEALSLLQRKELLIQIMRNDEEHGLYGFYRLPKVSGFRMAFKV